MEYAYCIMERIYIYVDKMQVHNKWWTNDFIQGKWSDSNKTTHNWFGNIGKPN